MKKESAVLTALLFFSGCSGHGLQYLANETFNNKELHVEQKAEDAESTPVQADVPPSRNAALQSVSPSKTASSKGNDAIQKNLDTWIEKEWTPTVETNESIKEMNTDKDRPFTLQEYADKAGIYMENQPESDTPSHTEELEKLPVIGK